MRPLRFIIPLFCSIALAGCQKQVEAPVDRGVCWHVVQAKDGKVRFNPLATHVPTIEDCAARLEGMRLHFLSLGGSQREVTGAYQGNFIFVQLNGIFFAQSLTGHAYPALVRTGDGRLAVPSAMPPQQ